jgi:hypothetical protein
MVLREEKLIEVKPSEINIETDLAIKLLYELDTTTSRIKSVEKLDDFDNENVYDIVMEDSSTPFFFGNGILLHNSTYFKIDPENNIKLNKKNAVLVADRIGELVNETFEPYMKKTFLCQPGYSELIKAAREMVADRGIFVAKKMYMLHIIDNEGYASDKLKVMGLATKRTTLPKEIANYINDSIKDFLKGSSWDDFSLKIVQLKEELQSSKDIMRIGLPKGVKKVEEYTQRLKRERKVNLPGHVAASIFWNQNIDKYQDKLSPRITSGMKIRVFYLNQTYGRFKSIAIPTDIDKVPDWVLENYTVDTDAQIERLVDKPIEGIMAAIGKKVPTKQGRFADSILEF